VGKVDERTLELLVSVDLKLRRPVYYREEGDSA
jgi:hypothetical protein